MSAVRSTTANVRGRPDADIGAGRTSAAEDRYRYRLRRASRADVQTLVNIERESFPTLTTWTPFHKEVGRESALYMLAVRDMDSEEARERRRLGIIPAGLFSRVASALTSQRSGPAGQPSDEYAGGAVGIWFVLDECHVVTIATRLADRRRGVGELLLIGAVEVALTRGNRVVTLEVRASNEAARSLYRKYGFQDVGLRKRYYSDNNEDAVIMTTPPIGSHEYVTNFRRRVKAHEERWGGSVRDLS